MVFADFPCFLTPAAVQNVPSHADTGEQEALPPQRTAWEKRIVSDLCTHARMHAVFVTGNFLPVSTLFIVSLFQLSRNAKDYLCGVSILQNHTIMLSL